MVDLRPLLSRNCPTATGATREYMLFYSGDSHTQTVWKDLRLTVCNLVGAASHLWLCKSISIAASEFKAIVTIKTSSRTASTTSNLNVYRVERGRTARE